LHARSPASLQIELAANWEYNISLARAPRKIGENRFIEKKDPVLFVPSLQNLSMLPTGIKSAEKASSSLK